jgi:hypothetical protein
LIVFRNQSCVSTDGSPRTAGVQTPDSMDQPSKQLFFA